MSQRVRWSLIIGAACGSVFLSLYVIYRVAAALRVDLAVLLALGIAAFVTGAMYVIDYLSEGGG